MKLGKILLFIAVTLMAIPAVGQEFTLGLEGFDADTNNWPGGEPPAAAIDGVSQKYLNFGKENTGIVVTPAVGSSVATSITLWAANDEPPRDPASFSIYGTNDAITAMNPGDVISGLTLIASDAIALPDMRGGGGMDPLLAGTSATVAFDNSDAYTSYAIVFPTLKDSGAANSMQVAEIQLDGDVPTEAAIFSPNDAIFGGQLTVIPEPASMLLALLCLVALVTRFRR